MEITAYQHNNILTTDENCNISTYKFLKKINENYSILTHFTNITNKNSIKILVYYCFSIFYDRMTVYRNRFLVNKTNRRTEFQFYWYYYYTCFGQPFCPSSGVLPSYSWQETVHHNCIKCTKADVRLRTPDDGQKGYPKHVYQ